MASSAALAGGPGITGDSRAAVDDLPTLLVFAAAVLLPFQNGILSEFGLGSFGASLSVVPIALLAGLWLLRALARPAALSVNGLVLSALAYVAATTLFGLWHFEWQYRQASLIGKALFAATHWSFFLVGIAAGMACRPEVLRIAVRIAIVVNAVGLLLIPGGQADITGLQSIALSSEPSHFGMVSVCLGALGAYLATSNRERFLILFLTLALAVVSSSKGALACAALAVVTVALFRPPQHIGRRIVLYLGVSVFAAALMIVAFLRLQLDLQEFASVATRSSGAITALSIGAQYPFGVGLAGFYPAFAEATPGSWRIITSYLGVSINLQEAFAFAYTDDRNLSAKTFFFDTLIYFGWPGLFAALWFTGRLTLHWLRSRRKASVWLAGGLVFAFLAMGTYNTVIPFYVVPMLLGFALRESLNP
jgi:hypothetical protein